MAHHACRWHLHAVTHVSTQVGPATAVMPCVRCLKQRACPLQAAGAVSLECSLNRTGGSVRAGDAPDFAWEKGDWELDPSSLTVKRSEKEPGESRGTKPEVRRASPAKGGQRACLVDYARV